MRLTMNLYPLDDSRIDETHATAGKLLKRKNERMEDAEIIAELKREPASELRRLPSVKQMLAIYSDAIKHGEKILLPRTSAKNRDTMIAMDVVKQINFGGAI